MLSASHSVVSFTFDASSLPRSVDLLTDGGGGEAIPDQIEAEAGLAASERRVWKLCSEQTLWSVFSKKRGLNRKAGPPMHDDLVLRDFTAARPD